MKPKSILVVGALTLATTDVAVSQATARHDLSADRGNARVHMQRVRIGTGVELHFAEAGPADGVPVLFLHGYSDSWYSFSPVLDRLPKGVRAIVPSQRGHGDSERPACCYGFPDLAADAVALLDALGIRQAAVVGHSMGSFVAQRVAIDHPERVSRLVLVGSGETYRTEMVSELWEVVRTLEDPVPPQFIQDFQVGTAARPLGGAFLATVIAESGKLPARVWRDALEQQLGSDAHAEVHDIRVPTLVISGERDEIFPGTAREGLARRIEGASLVVYEQTGHAIHWEEPDRFVADLEAFLGTRIPPESASAQ